MKFQLWETFFAVETEVSILAQCSHEHKKIYQILFGNSKYEQICILDHINVMEMNGQENVDKMSLRLSSQFSHEHLKVSNVHGKIVKKALHSFYQHFVVVLYIL